MQHCFCFCLFSESKWSLLPNCHGDKPVSCKHGRLFVSPLVNEKVSTFASSENKIGCRGAPVGAARGLGFVLCLGSMRHSLWKPQLQYSPCLLPLLLPNLCCFEVGALPPTLQLHPGFTENDVCYFFFLSLDIFWEEKEAMIFMPPSASWKTSL